jgi:hypothetical protein
MTGIIIRRAVARRRLVSARVKLTRSCDVLGGICRKHDQLWLEGPGLGSGVPAPALTSCRPTRAPGRSLAPAALSPECSFGIEPGAPQRRDSPMPPVVFTDCEHLVFTRSGPPGTRGNKQGTSTCGQQWQTASGPTAREARNYSLRQLWQRVSGPPGHFVSRRSSVRSRLAPSKISL